jgi:putative oxidoreductase
MKNIDSNLAPYGVFILRVALGIMWISHALLKWIVFSIPAFALWLGTQGLPTAFAWPVFLMEITGGLAIVLGIYARHVSILLAPIMLVAMWTHIPNGWLHTNAGGGWEYPAFLLIASFAIGLIGEGAFAIRPHSALKMSTN